MIEIIVPDKWGDVTVETYQRLKNIKAEDYKTPLLHTLAVVECLCNISDASILTAESFNEIAKELEFINKPIQKSEPKDINISGRTFRWMGNLNQLTMGEMVSIEQIIDIEDLTYDSSVDVIAAVLLRELNDKGEMLDFDSDNFAEYRELFGGIPITEVRGSIDFFLDGGVISTGVTPPYSITIKEKTIQKKSWLSRKLSELKKKIKTLISGLVLSTD